MPFISKISKIKNYKSWLNHKKETEFNKVNIIFGENGAGKSALCEILQGSFSLEGFNPKPNTEIEICMKDQACLQYANSNWKNQQLVENFIIFDSTYITNNIHINGENTGQKPKHKQNQNKLLVSFSKEAEELKEKERTAKDNLTQFETENKLILQDKPVLDTSKNEDKMFNSYQNLNQKSIDNIIKEKEDLKNNRTQKNTVNKDLLSKLTKIHNINILNFEISNIPLSIQEDFSSYFATELIKQSQEQAKIDFAKDELFFRKAHEKIDHNTKKCPVCLNIISDDIIKLYEENFNEVYKNKKIEFENTAKKLKNELQNINSECDKFNQKINYYKTELLKINNQTNNLFQNIDEIDAFLIKLKEDNKNDDPTETEDKPITKLISLIDKKQSKIVDFEINIYNQIKSAVDEIKEKQESLGLFIGGKIKQLEEHKLENTDDKLNADIQKNDEIIQLYNNEINFLKSDKIQRENQKLCIQKKKQKLKSEYDQARKNYADFLTGGLHIEQIERMQKILKEDFHVSFVLTHKPSVTTHLNLNDVNFDYEIQKDEKSLTLKDLSEGERQIIALAFFFAQIEKTASKQDKILIFDDPVTSMDARNLELLVDLISKKAGDFAQIFIFTHHQLFYKYLYKNEKINQKHNFIIFKNLYQNIECSYLLPDNPSKSLQRIAKLRDYCDILQESLNNSNLNYLDFIIEYGGMLRYSVETLIKDRILKSQASNFTDTIKNLCDIKMNNEEMENLLKVYNYCNYSNTSHFDFEITSLGELQVQIEKFLQIYNNYYPKNHEA